MIKAPGARRQDTSAEEIRKLLTADFQVEHYAVVPDEQAAITPGWWRGVTGKGWISLLRPGGPV